MYAVIETGGKQYRISPGDVIDVERLGREEGEQVEFDKVCLLAENEKILCAEEVKGARVRGTVLGEKKGKKLVAFKYKRRKNYKKKIGHRQKYTSVRVDEILAGTA